MGGDEFIVITDEDKIENIDYTVNYSNKTITLTDALDVIGTKVHFVVLKTVAATDPSTYDLLRGEGIVAGGTTGQVLLKNSDNDYDTSWGDVSAITVKRWMFNFTCDGMPFTALDNMTWTQFINSKYNTDKYFIITGASSITTQDYKDNGLAQLFTSKGKLVSLGDKIISNENYVMQSQGGSND